jgi:hypothetical protein
VRTRCDSPSLARSVDITFTPQDNGDVEVCCHLARAELLGLRASHPRPAEPDDEMLRVCAWCYRAERDGWRDIEDVVSDEGLLEQLHVPRITHGICDACLVEVGADFVDADELEPAAVSR